MGAPGLRETSGILCNFYPHLNWHKMLYKYEHLFSLKFGNLFLNWFSISVLRTYWAWKSLLRIQQNIKSNINIILNINSNRKGDSKNPNFPTLYWIRKTLEVKLLLMFKKSDFQSFSWVGLVRATFKNPKLGVVEDKPKTNTQKSLFWIYEWIRKSNALIYVSLPKIR